MMNNRFNKITKNQFIQVLDNYNFGKIKSIERLKKGYANQNFKIETDKTTLLFRVVKSSSLEKLENEIKILQELQNANFPIPTIYKNIFGDFINKTEFGIIVISHFIEGNEPEKNIENCKKISALIAQLNMFHYSNKFYDIDNSYLEYCCNFVEKLNAQSNTDLFIFLQTEIELLKPTLSIPLPRGLIHSDVFTDNTLFENGEVKALLDFEACCIENLLLDVAISINGFCFINNRLRPDLFEAFVVEYNKYRPLTLQEKRVLPDYIIFGALLLLSWRLEDLIKYGRKRDYKRIIFYMNRIKYLKVFNFKFLDYFELN